MALQDVHHHVEAHHVDLNAQQLVQQKKDPWACRRLHRFYTSVRHVGVSACAYDGVHGVEAVTVHHWC